MFDNSSEADAAEDVAILDQGEFRCDGTSQQAVASPGPHQELGILGMTGTEDGDEGESAWLTLANE